MAKVYVAIEAKTKKELFRGNLRQWDHFFSSFHSRLGPWIVTEDSRSMKRVVFHPISPAALLAFMARPETKTRMALV